MGISKRIVFATFGSLGDLHPALAVAIGLKARGHCPVIASHGVYREKVESEGIAFHVVPPDITDLGEETEVARRAFDPADGPRYLIADYFLPRFAQTYAATDAAAKNADLIVTHPGIFAGHLVAEKRALPWLSVALAPTSFFSAHDPAVLAPVPYFHLLQPALGPATFAKLMRVVQRIPSLWTAPVTAFRAEIGLPPTDREPLFDGQWSPQGSLAMFHPVLGTPQPDWPVHTTQTGFAFYDKRDAGDALPPEIAAFLDAGDPPIVFTLGSAAVMTAGTFYRESAAAAQRLGRRAILLTGRDARNVPASLPSGVAAFPYAPYGELFARCAAVVHQGGVGTTGQVLRAGVPQVVVPFGFDQPDNAMRVVRAGVARTLTRGSYRADTAERALRELLTHESYRENAARVGESVRAQDGIGAACDVIEAMLRGR